MPIDIPALQKLAEFKRILDADPTNVESANRYWLALASVGGKDVRSGGFAIEAFRACALASDSGVTALARAFESLNEKIGEKPRSTLFDDELRNALEARIPNLPSKDRAIVQWLLLALIRDGQCRPL